MSKGNMLLGYARGKVGDLVFSRLNGRQITRARNRSPKNPRTAAQMAQRAIMSTLGKAYSAGKEVFDHSFEGLKVGTENQSEFMKLNTNLFRNILVDELNDPPVNNNGISLVGPNSDYPVPGRYIISRGSYEQRFFRTRMSEAEPGYTAHMEIGFPSAVGGTGTSTSPIETFAQYSARTGLVKGDMYTFCFFSYGTNVQGNPCLFGFVRLKVEPSIEDTQVMDDITLGGIFSVASSFGVNVNTLLNYPIDVDDSPTLGWVNYRSLIFPSDSDYEILSLGIIRSHELSALRSNSQMEWCLSQNHPSYNSREYVEAWQAISESITDPALLLEGAKVDAGPIV